VLGDGPVTAGTVDPGDALLAATRKLLWIESPVDARAAASDLVTALGGELVPARGADPDALPVDVSFGVGEPLLPSAPSEGLARTLLARHLPGFVRDAHRAVELAARTLRLAEEAAIDPLTGLANRRAVGRALGRLQADDVVIVLDLDDFKLLNDRLGHGEGDEVLRAFGQVLGDTARARDLVGRIGGEEFLVILATEDSSGAEGFLQRLRRSWEAVRPHPVTFSAGIARADDHPRRAVAAADEAMYEAKAAGRDGWRWAGAGTAAPSTPAVERPARFVAFSRLTVPEDGRETLVEAFGDRLREVDEWPGFDRLEVWEDPADPTAFVMVSWWDTEETFQAYMASDAHRRSHARIPAGDLRPRPDTFHRYRIVAR
jgi:diguanylate cyclase (GGDEF)-like protein